MAILGKCIWFVVHCVSLCVVSCSLFIITRVPLVILSSLAYSFHQLSRYLLTFLLFLNRLFLRHFSGCRCSSVDIVTRIRTGDRRIIVRFSVGATFFLFSETSRVTLGPTVLFIQLVPGALSPLLKRSGRENDHIPPFSAEIQNDWSFATTSPYMHSGIVLYCSRVPAANAPGYTAA